MPLHQIYLFNPNHPAKFYLLLMLFLHNLTNAFNIKTLFFFWLLPVWGLLQRIIWSAYLLWHRFKTLCPS